MDVVFFLPSKAENVTELTEYMFVESSIAQYRWSAKGASWIKCCQSTKEWEIRIMKRDSSGSSTQIWEEIGGRKEIEMAYQETTKCSLLFFSCFIFPVPQKNVVFVWEVWVYLLQAYILLGECCSLSLKVSLVNMRRIVSKNCWTWVKANTRMKPGNNSYWSKTFF